MAIGRTQALSLDGYVVEAKEAFEQRSQVESGAAGDHGQFAAAGNLKHHSPAQPGILARREDLVRVQNIERLLCEVPHNQAGAQTHAAGIGRGGAADSGDPATGIVAVGSSVW